MIGKISSRARKRGGRTKRRVPTTHRRMRDFQSSTCLRRVSGLGWSLRGFRGGARARRGTRGRETMGFRGGGRFYPFIPSRVARARGIESIARRVAGRRGRRDRANERVPRGRAEGAGASDAREVRGVLEEVRKLEPVRHARVRGPSAAGMSREARDDARNEETRGSRGAVRDETGLFVMNLGAVVAFLTPPLGPSSQSVRRASGVVRSRALVASPRSMSWRDTLFFWRGEFRVDRDGAARFAGTWVGVDAGPDGAYASAPPDADFASARALRFAALANSPAPSEPVPATRTSATYAFPRPAPSTTGGSSSATTAASLGTATRRTTSSSIRRRASSSCPAQRVRALRLRGRPLPAVRVRPRGVDANADPRAALPRREGREGGLEPERVMREGDRRSRTTAFIKTEREEILIAAAKRDAFVGLAGVRREGPVARRRAARGRGGAQAQAQA